MFSASDYDVLIAAGDSEESVRVQPAEVAGAKPSIRGKGIVVESRIEISDKQFGSADEHLTVGANGDV